MYPNYPGSIVWFDHQYKLGKKQGGLQPADDLYDIKQLPIVKACSAYAGGALFLTYNAEDYTGSKLHFWASPTLEGLYDKGGNCPPRPTPPAPVVIVSAS